MVLYHGHASYGEEWLWEVKRQGAESGAWKKEKGEDEWGVDGEEGLMGGGVDEGQNLMRGRG